MTQYNQSNNWRLVNLPFHVSIYLQNQRRKLLIGAKGLKKVFRFGKFRSKKSLERSCENGGKLNSAFLDEGELVSRPIGDDRKPTDQLSIEIKTADKKDRSRIGTSGSELSEARHEHTHHNRNSSSG